MYRGWLFNMSSSFLVITKKQKRGKLLSTLVALSKHLFPIGGQL